MDQDSNSRPDAADSDRQNPLTPKSHIALEAARILKALREAEEVLSTFTPRNVRDENKVVLPPGIPEGSLRTEVIVLDPTRKGPWILDGDDPPPYAQTVKPEESPKKPPS